MKFILKITLFIILFPISAKATKPFVLGETERVYCLPKTELVIDIVSEKITEKSGKFAVYAEKYLGTREVILAPKTYFNLKTITISTRTRPDEKRTFRIKPKKKSPANKLVTNSAGILCGVNIQPNQVVEKKEVIAFQSEVSKDRNVLPLTEDYLMAGSLSKMAEGAAKQIFRIRESRLDLLSNYSEEFPKDGEAIKILIKQMDLKEKDLVKLFVGTISSEIVKSRIIFTPTEKVENSPIIRYSKTLGVVDKDDLIGEPILLSVDYNPVQTIQPKKKRKQNSQSIYTIIPTKTNLQITFEGKTIYQNQLFIPQLGILQPIPFREIDKDSRIYVDETTGRLLSIIED